MLTNGRYAGKPQRLIESLLGTPGATDPALRRAVEARAAALGGRAGGDGVVPEALSTWVEKVAKHAYKTMDEDVEALKRAGYSEDAIFEITLSAALGAGIARLERGLAALEGGE